VVDVLKVVVVDLLVLYVVVVFLLVDHVVVVDIAVLTTVDVLVL
jgi:hypothetical protein